MDTFLCFLGHLEHDFPCAVPSACLTWRPREILGQQSSTIKLSVCFQTLLRLILLQGQETDYSTLHQCNIFHRFCFRCYHLDEGCSMTFSRQVCPSHHTVHPTLLGRQRSRSSLSFSSCTFSRKVSSISKFLIQGHTYNQLYVHSLSFRQTEKRLL